MLDEEEEEDFSRPLVGSRTRDSVLPSEGVPEPCDDDFDDGDFDDDETSLRAATLPATLPSSSSSSSFAASEQKVVPSPSPALLSQRQQHSSSSSGGRRRRGGRGGVAWRAAACTAAVALGCVCVGYDAATALAAVDAALPAAAAAAAEPLSFEPASALLLAACPALAALGSLAAGAVVDRCGRRVALLAGAALAAAGAATVAAFPARMLWVFALGRSVVGAGLGLLSCAVPLYVAELAPAAARGSLTLGASGVAAAAGAVLGTLCAELLPLRAAVALLAAPALLLAAAWRALPESPRWLASRARTDEALHELSRLHGASRASAILESILDAPHIDVSQASVADILGRDVRRPLALAVALQFVAPLCGGAATTCFAGFVLGAVPGASKQFANAFSDAAAVAALIGAVLAALFADRAGRRLLLVVSSLGSLVVLVSLGLCTYFAGDDVVSSSSLSSSSPLHLEGILPRGLSILGWATAGYVVLAAALFGFGLQYVPTLLATEMFPVSIRGMACGVSMAANWASVTCTLLAFAAIRGSPEERASAMWTFAAFCAVALALVLGLVPETQLLTLESAQRTVRKRCTRGCCKRRSSRRYRL